jgi:2-polyprenyl-3-methyl-5-hydroxy-6-metoxy-1,4-benzoquinol methylase
MEKPNRKEYWENVYQSKEFHQVGWFQHHPTVSLDIIEFINISENAKIIDVGGGESYLVDHLLALGFKNIQVLDISAKAIGKAKSRLGKNAEKIKWITGDIVDFNYEKDFDLWHDRAVFHFLLKKDEIYQYIDNAKNAIKQGGHLIIGTFSDKGPDKCSGLPVNQYSISNLESTFFPHFKLIQALNLDHYTPSGQVQNYSFCCFERT